MISNVHEAKSQLSKLIERAEAGEEVVIARAGTPVVRLVPVNAPQKRTRREAWEAARREWAERGERVWMVPEAEMNAYEEELAAIMNGDDEAPPAPAVE
jgi:prevent-host-death family protein